MNTLFPKLGRGFAKEDSLFSEIKVENSASEAVCTNCGGEYNNMEMEEFTICKKCGEVQERIIDSGAEYRFFGSDDRGSSDPCRVGAPTDTRFPT